MDYKQPDFYHFSQDSLALVNKAIGDSSFLPKTVLDIGAGCGVLSIECTNLLKSISDLTLLEPQEAFFPFLEENLNNLLERKVKYEFEKSIFSQYQTERKFDLILCNPPYFEKGKGRSSPYLERQVCRTFEVDGPDLYLEKILGLLEQGGRGYILIPHEIASWEVVKKKYQKNLIKQEELSGVDIYLIGQTDLNK